MATIKEFEDLEIWKQARLQSIAIFKIFSRNELKAEFEIKSQMKRSSGSVMDNIAEGFERGGNAEFINFLGYAKGSNGEVRSQIHRLYDFNYLKMDEYNSLIEDNKKLSSKINSFIEYLKKSNIKGFKFHI
jgi:four helix bundle protein